MTRPVGSANLGWLGLGVLLLASTWFIASGRSVQNIVSAYVIGGLMLLVGMVLLRSTIATVWLLGWIIGIGLAMRIVCFIYPPMLQDDFYRFLWDGARLAHGLNPYGVAPADTSDPRFPIDNINHPHLSTIYPPVAQGAFALAYFVRPFDVVGLRVVFLACELVLLWLLWMLLRQTDRPVHWVAFYWWCPVVVREFYAAVHMDVVPIVFAMGAVVACVAMRQWLACVLLALAAGAKLWPIVLLPMVMRYGVNSKRQVLARAVVVCGLSLVLWLPLLLANESSKASGPRSYATQWINNAGVFNVVHWAMEVLYQSGLIGSFNPHDWARAFSAMLIAVGLGVMCFVSLDTPRQLVRACAIAVSGLFVLIPTQFPWYFAWAMPLLAASPMSAFLLYVPLIPLYELQHLGTCVLWIQHLPIWLMLGAGMFVSTRHWWGDHAGPIPEFEDDHRTPAANVAVIIPALNEERSIGKVIGAIPQWASRVIVADNGSADATARSAHEHGALVVHEPQRGYGAACLAAMNMLDDSTDIVVFLDADFSDHPTEMGRLVNPIARGECEMVIGSRVRGNLAKGALTPQQIFGNALACFLMRVLYGTRYTDLGPFRAVRWATLKRLRMDDRNFGWTVQMQVRAARMGVVSLEVPVSYRKRIGTSKISGTVRGVLLAGTKILSTVFTEGFRKVRHD